ncbi:MAG: transposase [Moorea sp. SIO3G5]|nr:transposase [Moorena sp. SIO3G5]
MARKRINKKSEYVVTRTGYCVGGQIERARNMAIRTRRLRSDIWNQYGSLKCWGIKAQKIRNEFKTSNPPEMYGLDSKQWQMTFERVIDDIHACQEAAKSVIIRKIYSHFKPQKDVNGKTDEKTSFRKELCLSLNSFQWMKYPLLHRWMRSAYHRGHSWVDNQICVGIGNGATISRVSRNVVKVTINGNKISARRYEKLDLYFKVGRCTPTGSFRIIFNDNLGTVELHYPKVVKRQETKGIGKCGLDKGYTEALTGSDGQVYGDGIGKVMQSTVTKRHSRGKGRNKLYQVAKKTGNNRIFVANLGKKKWLSRENKKKATLNSLIRHGVNQFFDKYEQAIVEDLSFVVKGKKQAKKLNRNLSEWCKGIIQKALEEISYRRQSSVVVVNAAYTSQVDSRYGVLLGTRVRDQFFTFDGVVLQADCNAGCNIEHRFDDPDISRFMKSKDVRKVLIERTASFLLERGFTLNDAVDHGWFDIRHLKGKRSKKATGLQ